jgi:hypothetical protein
METCEWQGIADARRSRAGDGQHLVATVMMQPEGDHVVMDWETPGPAHH